MCTSRFGVHGVHGRRLAAPSAADHADADHVGAGGMRAGLNRQRRDGQRRAERRRGAEEVATSGIGIAHDVRPLR